MKSIILYYSRSRKTAVAAKALANEISADNIEIEDLRGRSGVLNYIESSIEAFREIKTDIRPDNLKLDEYGLIYVGTPVWAGKPAPAIVTAIDKYNFQSKDVILFATMGSSGGKNAIKRMEEKIEARGGRIITSFIIKTAGKKMHEIRDDIKIIAEEMDLKIYGN